VTRYTSRIAAPHRAERDSTRRPSGRGPPRRGAASAPCGARRHRDTHHVGRDLDWLAAVIAALVIVAVIAYRLVEHLLISD
jgi:hypothetical protein